MNLQKYKINLTINILLLMPINTLLTLIFVRGILGIIKLSLMVTLWRYGGVALTHAICLYGVLWLYYFSPAVWLQDSFVGFAIRDVNGGERFSAEASVCRDLSRSAMCLHKIFKFFFIFTICQTNVIVSLLLKSVTHLFKSECSIVQVRV